MWATGNAHFFYYFCPASFIYKYWMHLASRSKLKAVLPNRKKKRREKWCHHQQYLNPSKELSHLRPNLYTICWFIHHYKLNVQHSAFCGGLDAKLCEKRSTLLLHSFQRTRRKTIKEARIYNNVLTLQWVDTGSKLEVSVFLILYCYCEWTSCQQYLKPFVYGQYMKWMMSVTIVNFSIFSSFCKMTR